MDTSNERDRRRNDADTTEPRDVEDLGLMSVPERGTSAEAARLEPRSDERSSGDDEAGHEHDEHDHMAQFPMLTLSEDRKQLVEVDPRSIPSNTETYGPSREDDRGPRSRRRGTFRREEPRERRDHDHRNDPGHPHDHDH